MRTSTIPNRLVRLAIGTLFVSALMPIVTSAAGITASATGSGHTTVGGELRTFSFTALQDASGETIGMAQINNRSIGEMFQLSVDCINVFGNLAIVSGVITRHTDVTAIGLTGIFAVLDEGEGANGSPDLVSQVFFFRPGLLTCADLGPADAAPFLVPLEAGDVQVR